MDQVDAIVQRLHSHGIALADLHHRDVLFVGSGAVFITDLATSFVCEKQHGALRHYLFRQVKRADRVALARMRARVRGDDPDQAMAQAAGPAMGFHRRARAVQRWLRRLRRRSS